MKSVTPCRECGEPMDVEVRRVRYDMGGFPRVTLLDQPVHRCEACRIDQVVVPDPMRLHPILALCKPGTDYEAVHNGKVWNVRRRGSYIPPARDVGTVLVLGGAGAASQLASPAPWWVLAVAMTFGGLLWAWDRAYRRRG